jgi:hypothetical protein
MGLVSSQVLRLKHFTAQFSDTSAEISFCDSRAQTCADPADVTPLLNIRWPRFAFVPGYAPAAMRLTVTQPNWFKYLTAQLGDTSAEIYFCSNRIPARARPAKPLTLLDGTWPWPALVPGSTPAAMRSLSP